MINDIYSKWKDLIAKNDGNLSISAFYVSKQCPSKLYFGFDGEKKYIYLEFDPLSLASFKCPKARGLDIEMVDIPQINNSSRFVQITNVDNKDEVFLAFCSTLYDELRECSTYFDVAEVLFKTIRYYKAYFSNPNKPLTDEEEQGLYAELVFLDRLISAKGEEVIKNWEGPNKNKRDFVFEEKSIEIKSTTSQINPSIRISNELQLDSSYPKNINLFLKVFVLEKVEEGDLNGKVYKFKCKDEETKNKWLAAIELKKLYIQKLLMNKVDYNIYQDTYYYSIQKERFYHVTDDFPSIRKSQLDDHIFKVEYYISLNDLDNYVCEEDI